MPTNTVRYLYTATHAIGKTATTEDGQSVETPDPRPAPSQAPLCLQIPGRFPPAPPREAGRCIRPPPPGVPHPQGPPARGGTKSGAPPQQTSQNRLPRDAQAPPGSALLGCPWIKPYTTRTRCERHSEKRTGSAHGAPPPRAAPRLPLCSAVKSCHVQCTRLQEGA